jgi:hypothetical protein
MHECPSTRRLRFRTPRALSSCLAILLAAVIAHPASAAPDPVDRRLSILRPRPAHRTGLTLSGLHCQVRDDIVSPLRWDGIGGSLELFRDRLDESSRRQISLRLPLALLNNRYEHRAAAPGLKLGYGRLYRVSWFAGSGATFAGVLFQGNMDLQYYVDWDEEHLYWITAYDIAAAVQHEIRVRPRRRLTVRVAVPPVSFVSRPPRHRYNKVDDFKHLGFWFRRPNERLRVTSMPDLLALTAAAEYTFRLGKSWNLGTAYEFAFRRFARPEPIRILTHAVSMRISHGP